MLDPSLMKSLGPIIGLGLALLLAGAIGTFLKARMGAKSRPASYRRREFLSPMERKFLAALDAAVGQTNRVFAQVKLADLIEVERGLDNTARTSAHNRIQSKHVDFIVCRANDLAVLCAIELDDSSHQRARTKARDEVKNQALAAAGLPLVRFTARQAFNPAEIRTKLPL